MHGIWLVSYGLLWLLLAVMACILLGILQQLARVHSALRRSEASKMPASNADPLSANAAPNIPLWSEDGERHHLTDYLGRRLLLVFSFPNCAPCNQLIPELNAFRQATAANGATIAVVTYCDPTIHREVAAAYADGIVVLRLADLQVLAAFSVPATPFAFLLDADGAIRAKGLVRRQEDLEALGTQADLEKADLGRVTTGAPGVVA